MSETVTLEVPDELARREKRRQVARTLKAESSIGW